MDTIKEEEKKVTAKQKKILKIFEECLGVVTQTCQEGKIPRSTFYKWKKENQIFAEAVEEIQDVALDFVETKMFERINEKSDYLIKFYLATKGKKRGYIEKTEMLMDIKAQLDVNLEAEVDHIFPDDE